MSALKTRDRTNNSGHRKETQLRRLPGELRWDRGLGGLGGQRGPCPHLPQIQVASPPRLLPWGRGTAPATLCLFLKPKGELETQARGQNLAAATGGFFFFFALQPPKLLCFKDFKKIL